MGKHLRLFVLVTACAASLVACATGEVNALGQGSEDDFGPAGGPQAANVVEPLAPMVPAPEAAPQQSNDVTLAPEPNAVSPPPEAAQPNATVTILGRLTADTNTVSWPGPVVRINFRGTGGSIGLQVVRGTAALRLDIDGKAEPRVVAQGNTSLIFGPLVPGEHVVELTKLSEAYLGTLRLGEVRATGVATPATAKERRIEFIGDSITAGYGIDAIAPCSNTAGNQNVAASYAALVAQTLDADYTAIAWSGMGLLRNIDNLGGTPPVTMTNYWRRVDATDEASRFVPQMQSAPQVVVVALGTNDFRFAPGVRAPIDHNAFVDAYVAFLDELTQAYPSARFVVSNSPMLADGAATGDGALHSNLAADLMQVRARVGARVRIADVPRLSTAQLNACGNHPNAAGHRAIARVVATAVKQQAGWE